MGSGMADLARALSAKAPAGGRRDQRQRAGGRYVLRGAAGSRGHDVRRRPDSAATLRLKGDGTASRIAVAEKGPIEQYDAWVVGGSAAIDGSVAIELARGVYVVPSGAVGVRYDTGAGKEGLGTEIGGGLDLGIGDLTVEGHGRVVAVQRAS